MRTVEQLVGVALGNPNIPLKRRAGPGADGIFELVDVRLPLPGFRGLPPDWTFAVLRNTGSRASRGQTAEWVMAARAIMSSMPADGLLVFVSEDPTVHMHEEFVAEERFVFTLDAVDLSPKTVFITKPRLAPFVLALRRRFPNGLSALRLAPYQREKPVYGWRFFGRDKELNDVIETKENVAIVGGRRVGKTSLMLEAAERLKARGEEVYYVDVQHLRSANEVMNAILRAVAPRDFASAVRRSQALGDTLFATVMKRLARQAHTTTFLLDELGNVIRSENADDWSFFGMLRGYSQTGKVRFVFSCFQELFLQQQDEFSGPLVNFAHTIRMGIFSDDEVRDFVLSPLEFWSMPDERTKQRLMDVVLSAVGRHPYLLQFFCQPLFDSFIGRRAETLAGRAHELVGEQEIVTSFGPAVEEVFYRMKWALLQYLFIRRCKEAHDAKEDLRGVSIDDDWVETILASMGYDSTLATRRRILEGLEIHGLCVSSNQHRRVQTIAAPIVFRYVRRTEGSLERFLQRLEPDIRKEIGIWGLSQTPNSPTMAR